MKVNIGKYPSRLECRIHTRYMDKKYGYVDWPTEYTKFETFLEKLEDGIQTVYNLINVRFLDERNQKIKVKINDWDTWSMDHTLAYIVLPMLIQLKETKHGAPYVEIEDRPEHLRPTAEELEKAKKEYDTDPHHFTSWDWALEEMIYAFDCKANKDDVYMRFDDQEEIKKEQVRISNGFRLFGKYYEALWD